MTCYTYLESPIGRLLLCADARSLTGLYMDVEGREPKGRDGWVLEPDAVPLRAAALQLQEYFDGTRRSFELPLALAGTPFQCRVWQALQEIPFGQTWSYGQLARRIGNPGASRAVGLANNRNPVSLIVPCHRVIGADGSLTGYGGGLERKSWLLDHEGALKSPARSH